MAFKTAVIGRTGRGDWGHAIDELFVGLPGTELVAVADESADGLATAAKRLGLDRSFTDWRRMLAEVRPEIVAICMRHVDCHAEMAIEAAKAGVKGIYGPGTPIPVSAKDVLEQIKKALG